MSHILITGGAGFIGTNLTQELRKRGHTVTVVDLFHREDPQHRRADVGAYRQLNPSLKGAGSISFIIWRPNTAGGTAKLILKTCGAPISSEQKT